MHPRPEPQEAQPAGFLDRQVQVQVQAQVLARARLQVQEAVLAQRQRLTERFLA